MIDRLALLVMGRDQGFCDDIAAQVNTRGGFVADVFGRETRDPTQYQAVIIDADHPEVGGRSVGEWLRRLQPRMPVILVGNDVPPVLAESADDLLTREECDGSLLVRTLRHAAARRLLERKLVAAQHEAEEARQAKNTALASMSYNLRTPLNTILGLLELIDSGVVGSCDNPRIVEYLRDIQSAGRSLLHVVEGLLQVAGIELALTSNESHYRQLIDMSPDAIIVCDSGVVSLINFAGASLFGAASPAELEGTPIAGLVQSDYRDLVADNFQALIDEGSAVPMRFLRGTEAIDVMVSAVPMANDPACVLLVVRNITDLMKSTRGILDRSKRLNSILQTAVDAIIVYSADGAIETFNHSAEAMFGYGAADIIGQDIRVLMPDLHAGEGCAANAAGKGRETIARRRNRTTFPVDIALSETGLDDRTIYTIIVRDITERKRIEDHLIHSASHDALTGLPNRVLLRDRLEQAILHSRANGKLVAVLFIDLDGFKTVNNTLGHLAGDELVVKVGQRLAASQHRTDTVGRFSGDEFTYLVSDANSVDAIVDIAQELILAFDLPFMVRERKVVVGISIGIAVFPRDGDAASDLIARAGLAMLVAKKTGRNQVRFFDPAMNQKAIERLTLEHAMRQGIEQREFCLHYQPQLCLKSGRVVGMEALVRWRHPSMGLVPPGKFIPIAEETGLIVPLGAWVLEQACRDAKTLHDSGFPGLRVAVNISGCQLTDSNLVELVEQVLHETGLDPRTLDLEITESMLMSEPEEAARMLDRLKRLGLRLSIDDFGTGFSSLSYLKRFSIDTIKIDQSFVREIAIDHKDRSITTSIITLAHSMGLTALAEGVEDGEQRRILEMDECDEVQGYGICRPIPLDGIFSFLEAWQAKGTGDTLLHTSQPG